MSSNVDPSKPILVELDSLLAAMRDAHTQEEADGAEKQAVGQVSSEIHAHWARQFVYDLHSTFDQLIPRIAPTLRRPVATRIDPIMNPFHDGTHHDHRTTLRIAQMELYLNACGGNVTVDFDDLRTQRRERFADLDSSDLTPEQRFETLRLTLTTFVIRSVAP